MSRPLLAALIFTYNHKAYIGRCIESLLNQKTTYHYEIRVYDDCSTDGTTAVCQAYADRYPERIKLTTSPQNTYLNPYSKMLPYRAVQEIDTKYFCTIDGDDCWCDENKVQVALDFLESHDEYVGFAHDTRIINNFYHYEQSYVHGIWKQFKNPIVKRAVPFFMASSRVFRNCGYKDKGLRPVDYLVFCYHVAKGPVYFYDKIMANYYIGVNNNFSNMNPTEEKKLNSTFGYKVAKMFEFADDDLAMDLQNYYNPQSVIVINRYKRMFGLKWGWRIWYFLTFVPSYGLSCLDLNWVGSRKRIKKRADNRLEGESRRLRLLGAKYHKKSVECAIIGRLAECRMVAAAGLSARLVEVVAKKKKKMRELALKAMHIKKMIREMKASRVG